MRLPAPGLGGRFWRLWTSSTVSAAGDGLTFVAIPLLAARITPDPAKVALVQTATYSSWLMLGLLAGALADRWDRLRIMAVSDLVRVPLFGAFAFAVAQGVVGLPLLVAFAFVMGVFGILNQNAASAVLPTVVARDRLESANSWLQAGMTVPSAMVGPPVGGLLFVAFAWLPFVLDAGSYLVSGLVVLGLSRLVTREVRTEPPPPLRAALSEGLRYLWRSQVLRTLCLLLAVFNATSAAIVGIFVLFAQEELGLSERGYGVLLTVFAVGALVGMATSSFLRRALGTGRVVALVLGVQAASTLATGLFPVVAVAAVGAAVAGASGGIWNVATISLRQRIVPDALLGRVTSAYRLVGLGAMPVGAAAGGLVASAYGLPATFLVSAAGLAVALLAGLRGLPRSVVVSAETTAAEAPLSG